MNIGLSEEERFFMLIHRGGCHSPEVNAYLLVLIFESGRLQNLYLISVFLVKLNNKNGYKLLLKLFRLDKEATAFGSQDTR